MRALTIDRAGGLEELRYREDAAAPVVQGAHDVRVRLHAAALNHLDLFTLEGLPHLTITPGFVLGADGAGVVDAVGSGVTAVRVGDRVMLNPGVPCRACDYCAAGEHPLCLRYGILGEHRPGTLAEFVVVPAPNVLPMPIDASYEVAAAFGLATLTAWRMVTTRAKVAAGEDVLIWGIGGGVAQAALQICKRAGARVWVTSRSQEKLERARSLGADELLLSGPGVDIGREVRHRTGKRGVDVVVDSVGQATWAQSLGALGRRGRLVTCGGTSGSSLEMDVRRLFWNQWTILGSTMGNDAEYHAIVAALAAGQLTAIVDSTFNLSDGRAAFERLMSAEQFGKVVVRMEGA